MGPKRSDRFPAPDAELRDLVDLPELLGKIL